MARQDKQIGVGGENPYKDTGQANHGKRTQKRINGVDQQSETKRLFHTIKMEGAIVVADNRLCAQRDTLHRQLDDLEQRRQNGQAAHRQVAAEKIQLGVEADVHSAFGGGLEKWRDAQRKDLFQDLPFRLQIPAANLEIRLFSEQKLQHPYARDRLGKDSGQCRALDAHVKGEDKQRVERDVEQSADQHSSHADAGKPLRVDIVIHADADFHKHGAQRIDQHIVERVRKRVVARAKQAQQRFGKNHGGRRDDNGGNQDTGEAVGHNMFGFVVSFLAHADGAQRRAALAKQAGKRCDDEDERGAQADSAHGEAAVFHMSDIDAVNHVIEQGDQLRQNHGQRQGNQQWCDWFCLEFVAFFLFHSNILPENYRLEFCGNAARTARTAASSAVFSCSSVREG